MSDIEPRVNLTVAAFEKLDEELLVLRKRAVDEIVKRKSYPGEDPIEISGNEVASLFREIHGQIEWGLVRRSEFKRRLALLYILAGAVIVVLSVASNFIISLLSRDPERIVFFVGGLSIVVAGIIVLKGEERRLQRLRLRDSVGRTSNEHTIDKEASVATGKREVERLQGHGAVEMPDGSRIPSGYDVRRFKHYELVRTNMGDQQVDVGFGSFTCRLSHGGRLHPDLTAPGSMFLILEDGRRLELLYKRANMMDGVTEVVVTGGLIDPSPIVDDAAEGGSGA